jgi:hypothetical protein
VSGKSSGVASSTKRTGSLLRSTSPKSPVASASAFESVEGSDDEDNMTDNAKLDATYLHTNGNAVGLLCTYKSTFFFNLFIFYFIYLTASKLQFSSLSEIMWQFHILHVLVILQRICFSSE